MNAFFQKKELRDRMRRRRDELPFEEKRRLSDRIIGNVTLLKEYKESGILLTYVSLEDEVCTFGLIEAALRSGKRVAVPRCVEGRPVIEFYFIHGVSELKRGTYGVLEPAHRQERLCKQRSGFCILPGLSFDRNGARLGYGKGYYDRFLQKFKGTTAGLCFSHMLAEKPLPTGRFDVPADYVVTEKEIIKASYAGVAAKR